MYRMADEDFKAFYNMLKKKYNLPPLDEMDEAFEITLLDPGRFFLREMVRRMSEYIDYYFKILDRILHPDTKIWEIRESNTFNEAAQKRIYGLYKRLKFYYRFSDEAIINGKNDVCAQFISSFFKDFPGIKKEMLDIVREMKVTWQKELKEKTDLGYLG